MIDFDDMNTRHEEGMESLDSLEGDEKDILLHYCSLVTQALLKQGSLAKKPVDQLVVNALRSGIALGTRLRIVRGEVMGR